MPTPQKATEIADLADRFSRAQLAVITDYRGLSVASLQDFRARIKPMDAEFRVAKNTLTRIASEQAGIQGLAPTLEGPTAILFAYGDIAGAAKALGDYARSSRILQVRAGVLDGQVLGPSDIEAIASLPPREELLGKLVGMLASPMARTVGVLSGPSRSLVYLLNSQIESLGGAPDAVAAD